MNFEFDITYNCNLACTWCNRLCNTRFTKPDNIPVLVFASYVDSILPHITSQSRITIIGGEPTLHPDIFKILDIAIQKIRPLLSIPILLVTNNTGHQVQTILAEIKSRYTTWENPYALNVPIVMIKKSDIQFCIVPPVNTKESHVRSYHKPIFRAAQDFLPNKDYAKTCRIKRVCGYGVTPQGIYICAFAASISRIFHLPLGASKMLSTEEEEAQIQNICKYCNIPCEHIDLNIEISKTYETIFKS